MHFEIIGEIIGAETIVRREVRELARLRKFYGRGRGGASATVSPQVRLSSGDIVSAEIRWYEATGIGKRQFNIKRIL